jgi:hypothetical protein
MNLHLILTFLALMFTREYPGQLVRTMGVESGVLILSIYLGWIMLAALVVYLLQRIVFVAIRQRGQEGDRDAK